ncbi:hypothetical protein ON010_g6418 [Phytophthora cinnamomi]|nr:hypothetical protein ON010_g6418 [Phytophthora cinnamomi]
MAEHPDIYPLNYDLHRADDFGQFLLSLKNRSGGEPGQNAVSTRELNASVSWARSDCGIFEVAESARNHLPCQLGRSAEHDESHDQLVSEHSD